MSGAHTTPNPGSREARDLGCICAIYDNHHGTGSGPFWVTEGCPVHHPVAATGGTNDGE